MKKNRIVFKIIEGENIVVKISACVITKNEAESISRCLQSVKDIVNEMIVVDTGSTDDTVKISEQLGAEIFHYQWCNDFSAARNYALEQAKGDWIIFLDADEYIAVDKIKNVRSVIDEIHGDRRIEAVRCQMKNIEGIGGSLRSSNPSVRIFRNSQVIRYKGSVHESIFKRMEPVKTINVKNRVIVYHTGYTKETVPEKMRRNTVLLEEELKKGIVRNLTYYYLSDSYWRDGEYQKAIVFAQKAIKYSGMINAFDYKPYVILISSMTNLKTYNEEAVNAICDEALEKFPHHPEIWLLQGLYYRSIGRCEKALTFLLKAFATNICYNDFNRNNDFYALSSKGYFNIAQIYEMKNQSVQALNYYTKVLQQEKFHQVAFTRIISLIREQDPADVIYFFNTLYNITNKEDIRFSVENLSQLKFKKVLDYYHQILLIKFDDNSLNGAVLLTYCKFEDGFRIFADFFCQYGNYNTELLAVASLLIGGSPNWVDLLGAQLHCSFRKIIAAFFQMEKDIQLSADDFPLFCDLVKKIACFGNQKQMKIFLELGKKCFSDEAISPICTILLDQNFFGYALDMYLYYIKKASSIAKLPRIFYCEAGYCCYKLEDFAGAANYFSQALEFGYSENYVFDFIEWSYQQCHDEVIKGNLKILKNLYRK